MQQSQHVRTLFAGPVLDLAAVVDPHMKLSYAIAFVSDMSRSVAFYRDIFGLPLKFESPGWTEFATEGATFAIHAGEAGSQPPADAKGCGFCRPGFSIQDLDSFHRRMIEAGVPCVQPPRNVFGARIAQYADPDGLVISVSEGKGT